MKIKNIAEEIIKIKNEKLLGKLIMNENYYETLLEYCDALDVICKEVLPDDGWVNIKEDTNEIEIGFCSGDFVVKQNYEMFCDLLERATSFKVKQAGNEGGSVLAIFTFPSIWE